MRRLCFLAVFALAARFAGATAEVARSFWIKCDALDVAFILRMFLNIKVSGVHQLSDFTLHTMDNDVHARDVAVSDRADGLRVLPVGLLPARSAPPCVAHPRPPSCEPSVPLPPSQHDASLPVTRCARLCDPPSARLAPGDPYDAPLFCSAVCVAMDTASTAPNAASGPRPPDDLIAFSRALRSARQCISVAVRICAADAFLRTVPRAHPEPESSDLPASDAAAVVLAATGVGEGGGPFLG